MDVSGEIVWHGLIRMPFQDISGIVAIWSPSCDFFAIAEHEPDEDVEVRHCHIMLGNPAKLKNTLQKNMKDKGINPGRGNHWIMDKVQGGEHKGEPYKRHELLVYLLKGSVTRLKYSKNIPDEQIEAAAASWVEHSVCTSTPPANSETKKKKIPDTHYQTCKHILSTAKTTHPEWFKCDITSHFTEDEDEFTLRPDYHKHMWDLMTKELNKREIRCSINELERFYTTIMRNDYQTKSLLFQNFWRKIRV